MEGAKNSAENIESLEQQYDVQGLSEALKKAGIEISQLKKYLKAAARLRELEKQYGKSYQVLLREYEKKFRESVKLEYNISELLEKRKRIEEDLKVYMEQQKLTLETINKVASVLQTLQKYSIDVGDIEKLAKVAEKIAATGMDFKQLFETFSKLEDAESRLAEADKRLAETVEKLRKAEEELQSRVRLIQEVAQWWPEIESIAEVRTKLAREKAELELKLEETKQKLESLTSQYEAILGFKVNSEQIVRMIEEKKNELNRLEEEVVRKKETLQILDEELASARSLLVLLQNPELVKKDDLEALSRQFANLANIKSGVMPSLKALEPSLMENVRKRVVELVMPVIRTELVPRWVFEKLEKEFKDIVAKKVQLEEELEKIRNELGQNKSSKTSVFEQPPVQQPKQFRLLKKGVMLTSDSGVRIRLKCIYCQNSTLMMLPVKEDLAAAASKDLLVTSCSYCGKEISVDPTTLIDRFFKG
ncbi:MAG: hypothetical protein QXF45_00230 [Candidatus Caldarchaeum sp.]|uniref:Uncharacterized protein n=1 Tax=Caldiarchaeum subterraneum TaxID=311458 RepID=A0A7C5YF81_CALS0